MTKSLKVARSAGKKILDAKMAASCRISEIKEIMQEATKKRRLLDNAELQQIVILDVATLREIETILDAIEAVTE